MFRYPAALVAAPSRVVASALALSLASCGPRAATETPEPEKAHRAATITLSAEQIAAAGIILTAPATGTSGGSIEAPAMIEGDPQATQIVSAAVGGRIISLSRNLGETVRRGDTLAVIESREAAALNAEVETARARAVLAHSNLAREEKLFAMGYRPEREVLVARAAATEANVALRLAGQQVAAAGLRGSNLNRIAIGAPIGGQVIGRTAVLGQTVAADAELFRVANLRQLSVSLSLSPTDAGQVSPGASVEISAAGRRDRARVTFVSPVLDEATRLVRVIAVLDNRAGRWRAGEPVQASIRMAGQSGGSMSVPAGAVQSVENRSVVFVRTATGFRVAPVTLGRRDGPMVGISSGLTGTETIASGNSFTLKAELRKGDAGHED